MSALPGMIMSCDVHGCLREVKRGPRIVIPAKWAGEPLEAIRIMTTLHYCDEHRNSFDLAGYLTVRQKRRIEQTARIKWAGKALPDFDAAFVEMMLVTTPEYRAFMTHVGVQVVRSLQ